MRAMENVREVTGDAEGGTRPYNRDGENGHFAGSQNRNEAEKHEVGFNASGRFSETKK